MQNKEAILDQIRALVADLSPEERLSIIGSIASVGPTHATQENDIVDAVEIAERQRLIAEQEAWFARSPTERMAYRGKFVAIHSGKVIDSDTD